MPTATLTSKGQLTMPQGVRLALGLHAGSKVDFVEVEGGYKIVPLRSDASTLKGRFAGRVAKPVSLQAMEAAVSDAAVARSSAATLRKRRA